MSSVPPQPPPTHPVDSARDVLESVADAYVLKKLTGEQWVACALAAAVFLLVSATIFFNFRILAGALPPLPATPKTTAEADLAAYRLAVEQYATLTNAAHERARNMFETFVASSLLPIFTGIVGFIFGRERSP